MKINKTIQIDLAARGAVEAIGTAAVAGDSGSRRLTFELLQEGLPWPVPQGVRAALAFKTALGSQGEYDLLPDGSDAAVIDGNRITVGLADAILEAAGSVELSLVLRDRALNRLATFPVILEVDPGLEGVQPLPVVHYRLRDLDEINGAIEALEVRVDSVDAQAIHQATQEAREAAALAAHYAELLDTEQIREWIRSRGEDLDLDPDTGRLRLISEGNFLGEGVELPSGTGGLAFDGGYVDEGNMLHLTLDGVDIEGFEPFEIPAGGGGGGGSVVRFATDMPLREFSILDQDETCVLSWKFNSVDALTQEPTGDGALEVLVGGSRVAAKAITQGEGNIDVREFLVSGAANSVTLRVTDAYGQIRTIGFTITVTAFGLSWNLGETGIYGQETLIIRLTPTGNGGKDVVLAVDGKETARTTVETTGRTISMTVPAQGHGVHTVTAWVEATVNGEKLTTEPLTHTAVWLGEGVTTPVVAMLTPELTVGRWGTASIRYFVVDPGHETTDVTLKVNGVSVNILQAVGRDIQVWPYKAIYEGTFGLAVHCGSASASMKLNVTGNGYDIAPITAGLELDLDPSGHSNSEAGRHFFGYTDAQGVNHPLTFSNNFDWVGGGFQTDENGVTAFVVKRGCSVAFDRSIFDTDPRRAGRNIKLIFRSENVCNYDAELLRCKSGNVGLVVQAQQATVSSELESMNVQYCEGRKVEMDVCIEAENEHAMAWIDLKAIPSCPPVKYGATDSWVQTVGAPLTIGSEDADVWIYRMKIYSNSLNRFEVLDNFIADCADPAEMAERYERNDVFNTDGTLSRTKLSQRNGDLRVIHIKADRMTTGKEDEVTGDFELLYGNGGESHHLTAQGITFKAQGTSSLEYILAALNLDIDFSRASSWINGRGEAVAAYAMRADSIPVDYFNLKANVASSESANNICIADDFNEFAPFHCAAQKADRRVRDSVEGNPCAVFFTNTSAGSIDVGARTVAPGETILYFAGDMNNSKKNFAVFGQDNSRWPQQCSVEIMNNTERPCRFLDPVAADEKWKDGDFEFRFPKTGTDEMKEAFRAMQAWVVSTAQGQETNAAFPVPVNIGGTVYAGDTAEYRKAKFLAEFEDYFHKPSALFNYLMTERHCLADNRAKNVFPCYEWVEAVNGYRWVFRNPYDCDTAEGTDNSGGMTFTYGLEDTDMAGDAWVFNAHDSALWCNIRDYMADDLKAYYIANRGTGVWNADRFLEKVRSHQAATPEAVRIEDMWNKYFLPWINKDAAAYAKKCYGAKEYQREQFEQYQQIYMDSKYCDVTDRSDCISMRVTVDRAENGNMTITTYSDMYIVVMYGNGGRVVKRVKRNMPTLIECPTDSLGDTETYLFFASRFTSVSSLASMKPKFVLATTASRLRELVIGSGSVGYQNLNLNQIGVGANRMLRKLDLRGTPNLVTALDLSALTSLEEFLANGSGLTGLTFAKGAPVHTLRLPAVSSLVALELRHLETFVMDARNLLAIRVEDCPGIDTLELCKAAEGLNRGRLTGVNWVDEDAGVLIRLAELQGMDSQGKPTATFVLTGKCHVTAITEDERTKIAAAFPELELSYDTIVPTYTVTFLHPDGTVLNTQHIRQDGRAVDPVSAGMINTPVKDSDVEHHYIYAGWDQSLQDIAGDRTITAVFAATDRYYRVTYWSDTAETKVLLEETILAHAESEYNGDDPVGEGVWIGWDADTTDVVRDMDVHAMFLVPTMPEVVVDRYEYLYSDDPADDSAYSLEEFFWILENGAAKVYFQIGDRIRMIPRANDIYKDEGFVLQVCDFNHFRLADGSGMAGVVFGMVGVMNAGHRMNAAATNEGGWRDTEMRSWLNGEIFPTLPVRWKTLIREVEVRTAEGGTGGTILTTIDRLFLLGRAETGLDSESVPHCNEVDAEAEHVVLPVFTDTTSRVRKTFNGMGSAQNWWHRTPDETNMTHFYNITSSGLSGGGNKAYTAIMSNYVSWYCCMGVKSV